MIKYENHPVGWQGGGGGIRRTRTKRWEVGVWCGEILVLKLRKTGGK